MGEQLKHDWIPLNCERIRLEEELEKLTLSYKGRIKRLKDKVEKMRVAQEHRDATAWMADKTNYWVGNKLCGVKSGNFLDDNGDLVFATSGVYTAVSYNSDFPAVDTITVKHEEYENEHQQTGQHYSGSLNMSINRHAVSSLRKGYQNVTKDEFMRIYRKWMQVWAGRMKEAQRGALMAQFETQLLLLG